MDYHVFKSALNGFLARYVGGHHRPVFCEVLREAPELDVVTRAFPVIRQEFQALLARQQYLPCYHDIDPGEEAISNSTRRNWNVAMLEIMGHRLEANRALCPETCRALEQVPQRIQAFFSILEPGKSIPEHEGPYLGYLRYHLALQVPREQPPCLIVAGQRHVWREGEAVLFDDSWPHEVVNHSQGIRGVLVVDVMRPLPLLPAAVNWLALRVLARHTYGRQVARKARTFAVPETAQRRAA